MVKDDKHLKKLKARRQAEQQKIIDRRNKNTKFVNKSISEEDKINKFRVKLSETSEKIDNFLKEDDDIPNDATIVKVPDKERVEELKKVFEKSSSSGLDALFGSGSAKPERSNFIRKLNTKYEDDDEEFGSSGFGSGLLGWIILVMGGAVLLPVVTNVMSEVANTNEINNSSIHSMISNVGLPILPLFAIGGFFIMFFTFRGMLR